MLFETSKRMHDVSFLSCYVLPSIAKAHDKRSKQELCEVLFVWKCCLLQLICNP